MRRYALSFLLILTLLVGCNMPTGGATPDLVATQVATMLTPAESATAAEPMLMTATPGEATPIPSPTQQPPTATAVPATNTPTQTAVPQAAAPTINPNDPKASLGQPTWQDGLASSKNFYKYENDHTRVTAEEGALLLTGIKADGWMGWSLTHSQQPLNFYLEATFIPQSCSGSDVYGMVFRATDSSGYFFGATCDGRYQLRAQNFNDGTDRTIIDFTSNSAIASGANQTNRLGVMVNGSQFTLYANGAKLTDASDETFKDKGYIGAFVAANQVAGFTVKMDEISLWKLP